MKIILAPKNLHQSILKTLRKDDPFLDIKLFSKGDLRRYFYPSIREAALIYLMQNHSFSYEKSKFYLENITNALSDSENKKIHDLYLLKKELEENDLVFYPKDNDPIFLNNTIEVYGYYEEDIEIISLLNKANAKYIFHKNLEKPLNTTEIKTFPRVEEEVYYILNEIAKTIDEGRDINDIYILNRNKDYDYYLKKFAPKFGFQLNIKSDESYSSSGLYKKFMDIFEENHNIDETSKLLREEIINDPFLDDFLEAVNDYDISGYKVSFEIQKDYLKNKLKEKKRKSIHYDKAVTVIDSPIFYESKVVFVIGFGQSFYPRSNKETSYFNDLEAKELNILNAKEKTKIDALALYDFFYSNNLMFFSYSKNSLSGNITISPINKTLDLKLVHPEISPIFYSEATLSYFYSSLKDADYYYKEKSRDFLKVRDSLSIKYNSYRNDFKGDVRAYNEKTYLKLSTTGLDLYSNCPFHYYLTRVLKLDKEEEIFAINLGNVAHHIFEHMREDGFDFEVEYQKALEEENFETNQLFLLNTKIKEQILEATKAIKLREKYYTNPTIYNEEPLAYPIDDITTVVGKIDNLVVLDNEYFVCIDYKTGNSAKFDERNLKYGLSSQLPTYSLLAKHKFGDLKVAGLYLNHVISTSLTNKKDEEDLIYDYLKLGGLTLYDLDAVLKIDSTITNGQSSSFITSIKMKNDGTFAVSNSFASEAQFSEYAAKVASLYVEMAKNLRKNAFEIYPLFSSKGIDACKHCQYKDVCYVKNSQRHLIVEEEEEVDE